MCDFFEHVVKVKHDKQQKPDWLKRSHDALNFFCKNDIVLLNLST